MNGKRFLKQTGILFFWLAVWELLAVCLDSPLLFASPFEVFRKLFLQAAEPMFWRTVGWSLLRIAAGFLAGLLIGLAAAALCAGCSLLEEFLRPVFLIIKTVPVVSFVVLILIWRGAAFLSVFVSFLMVLPTIYFSALEGIRSAPGQQLEMARVFRLPKRTVLAAIYRPALRPYLYGSMKTGLGLAWKAGVAAEVIGLPSFSIGEQLYLSKLYLDTAGIFAWTIVVVCLSCLFEKAVLLLTRALFDAPIAFPAPHFSDAGSGAGGAVRAENLKKSFGEKLLFQELSFTLLPGQIRFLTWPSGAGKTTLLRVLAGLEKPDEGSAGVSESGAAVSMLFQEDRLCMELSALQNVEMVTGDRESAAKVLERLIAPELFSSPCRLLSGGERRRTALARALAAQGEVLLLDEPFAGLDEEAIRKAWEAIRDLRGERSVLIAGHILPQGAEGPNGAAGVFCEKNICVFSEDMI